MSIYDLHFKPLYYYSHSQKININNKHLVCEIIGMLMTTNSVQRANQASTLSWGTRVKGFLICFILGVVCSILVSKWCVDCFCDKKDLLWWLPVFLWSGYLLVVGPWLWSRCVCCPLQSGKHLRSVQVISRPNLILHYPSSLRARIDFSVFMKGNVVL